MSAPDFYLEAFPLEQGGEEAKHNNLAKIECSGRLKQLKCRVLYQRRRNYSGKEFQKLSIGISLSFRLNTKLHICRIRLHDVGASLVAQWLRIRLPMQETRVRALVPEDPTCRGTAKPVCHNY